MGFKRRSKHVYMFVFASALAVCVHVRMFDTHQIVSFLFSQRHGVYDWC